MKKDIEIIKYTHPKVEVIDADDNVVLTLDNDIELVRLQIKLVETQTTDKYRLRWESVIMNFTNDGSLERWPRGMYDEAQKEYSTLFRLSRKD